MRGSETKVFTHINLKTMTKTKIKINENLYYSDEIIQQSYGRPMRKKKVEMCGNSLWIRYYNCVN